MMWGCTRHLVALAWPWAVARRLCDLRVLGRQLSGNREAEKYYSSLSCLPGWRSGRGRGGEMGTDRAVEIPNKGACCHPGLAHDVFV